MEQLRQAHETVELTQKAIVREMGKRPRTAPKKAALSQRIGRQVRAVQDMGERLAHLYTDEDECQRRRHESQALEMEGPALFAKFYDQLREVRDYHRRFPDAARAQDRAARGDMSFAFGRMEPFTGEEWFGKYLDLNEHFRRYLNLVRDAHARRQQQQQRGGAGPLPPPHIEYTYYLAKFYRFSNRQWRAFPRAAYTDYLNQLRDYLLSFVRRAHPLVDLDAMLAEHQAEFDTMYESQKSWPDVSGNNDDDDGDGFGGSLTGGDVLMIEGPPVPGSGGPSSEPSSTTEGQPDDPLYCTACQKRFAKQTVFDGHLQGKKHKRAVAREQGSQGGSGDQQAAAAASSSSASNEPPRDLFWLEFQVHKLGQALDSVIAATITNTERKQASSYEERRRELEDAAAELGVSLADGESLVDAAADADNLDDLPLGDGTAVDSDDDDEMGGGGAGDDDLDVGGGPKMSIDNYPVGWDGKPIPVWLYKLHGLGVKFNCEICGNLTYYGPLNFQRHFAEWRHAHGLSALGIQNSPDFHGVTLIEEALALNRTRRSSQQQWKPEEDEEFEDDDGNVYDRKTYFDLKKQGII